MANKKNGHEKTASAAQRSLLESINAAMSCCELIKTVSEDSPDTFRAADDCQKMLTDTMNLAVGNIRLNMRQASAIFEKMKTVADTLIPEVISDEKRRGYGAAIVSFALMLLVDRESEIPEEHSGKPWVVMLGNCIKAITRLHDLLSPDDKDIFDISEVHGMEAYKKWKEL